MTKMCGTISALDTKLKQMKKTPKIKVCGMRQPDNIRQLATLKPDFMGLIFYAKSKRFVPDEEAEIINNATPQNIEKVGVFVNEALPIVISKINLFGLSAIQLHGNETPQYCAELRDIGLTIIKAFGVGKDFDFSLLDDYKPYCDYFLFDTQSKAYGGTGTKFDWRILKNYDNEKPIFLSGGIGPEDAEDILSIENLNIYSLDINSCFETEPALKDIDKLNKFITKIRA